MRRPLSTFYGAAGRRTTRGWIALWLLMSPQIASAQPAPVDGGQPRPGIVSFSSYSALAGNAELARRLMRPLDAAQLPIRLEEMHAALEEQPVDLASERFYLRVPVRKPTAGYGLIVFVPPWNDAHLPEGWAPVLDQLGLIFVSASRSGNDQNPIARREPLAILAAFNVMTRFPVAPSQIVIAGFSGGSRIALRLALGYPDLFQQAILDAGADPIGTTELPLPSQDLFALFRSRSRIAFAVGSRDDLHLEQTNESAASLEHWCASHFTTHVISALGHDVMPGSDLASVLAALSRSGAESRRARDDICWNRTQASLAQSLSKAAQALAGGDAARARGQLKSIDGRFGGLAGSQVIDLARQSGLLSTRKDR